MNLVNPHYSTGMGPPPWSMVRRRRKLTATVLRAIPIVCRLSKKRLC
jgi:hypothetical protein